MNTAPKMMNNGVAWLSRGRWNVRACPDAASAYRLWLSIRRGCVAILWQNGREAGRGNALESN